MGMQAQDHRQRVILLEFDIGLVYPEARLALQVVVDSVFHARPDLRHLVSVMPYRSAKGREIFLRLEAPNLGITPTPASQAAQCHASALSILSARMMKVRASP